MLTLFLIFLLIIIAFLLLLILVGFFIYIFDAFLELPYVATKKSKVSTIIELANIQKKETAVDLGSGDGRLLFAAADKGAFAIGYEVNPMLVLISRVHAKIKGLADRVSVRKTSLWKADLKSADVIFVYARQGTMKRMEDFIYINAKKGSRVAVNTDLTKPFPTKKPIKTKNGIFLYRV